VGLNLLLSIATLGRWQAGPVTVAMVGRHSLIAIEDVASASCYCDQPSPIVSDLK
jgi:hypothetical protein